MTDTLDNIDNVKPFIYTIVVSQKYFLIDFDSTFIKTESLEELAELALENIQNKNQILEKIKDLTAQGMEGKIPFDQSLRERLLLLRTNQSQINRTAQILQSKISDSLLRNKNFFRNNNQSIYIISGGFTDCILPVVQSFGVAEAHVFANTFTFDKQGTVTGFDTNNPLSQADGKVKLLRSLDLQGEIHVLGDGYTDYQLKALGLAKTFTAFTENITREIVTRNADYIAASFEEFISFQKEIGIC